MQEHKEWCKDQRYSAQQLDHYMERRTGGILEGIAHGIAYHTGFMGFALLTQHNSTRIGIEMVNDLALSIDT